MAEKAVVNSVKTWLFLKRHGRSVAAASISIFVVLISWLMFSSSGLLAAIGLLNCVLLGLSLRPRETVQSKPELSTDLELPFLLAHDDALFLRYRRASKMMLKVSRQQDSIYRGIALDQIDDLIRNLTTIASGTLVFEGTETWRIVYERLLRSSGLYLYRSVAWVKTADYWQDEPGRKSMQVNFELHDKEILNIERIAIIADSLWPSSEIWPVQSVRNWLQEQHEHGIWIRMVRESVLRNQPDLITDMGIYGSRALGIQELDHECRTARFVLTFDFGKVTEAEDRWNRLDVYAESFASYLDRYGRSG